MLLSDLRNLIKDLPDNASVRIWTMDPSGDNLDPIQATAYVWPQSSEGPFVVFESAHPEMCLYELPRDTGDQPNLANARVAHMVHLLQNMDSEEREEVLRHMAETPETKRSFDDHSPVLN